MIKFILWFANCVWWPKWSNHRWNKERKIIYEVKPEHLIPEKIEVDSSGVVNLMMVDRLSRVKALVNTLYRNFDWTADGWDQLRDSICPPAYNYKRWCEGVLKDDCDGFHSLVYHCLQASGIECYLLSATTMKDGHCILLFKLNDKWYVNDYYGVHNGFATAKEAILDYNAIYERDYEKNGRKVQYNALIKFDYKKKKFKSVSIKKLDK